MIDELARVGTPMERVAVASPAAPYDVLVGAVRSARPGSWSPVDGKVAVVSQPGVADWHAPALTAALHAAGADTDVFLIGDGEDAKTLATVDDLCRRLAGWGLLRGDAVVALGGGVVGDTAGFAAAVYHRGVAVVQAPTTLLAQVDAAIGGKTAVNLPEGKNLVGAFHQPIGVLADVEHARHAAPREYRAGLGEVAKYALMPGGDEVAARRARARRRHLARATRTPSSELVAACAAIKAGVVAADPEERTGHPRDAQLRPHPRPRARDGRRVRAAARRSGRGRPRVRGRARRRVGAHRRRMPSTGTATSSSRSTFRSRSRATRIPTRSSTSCAATRRRPAASPSCCRDARRRLVLETVARPRPAGARRRVRSRRRAKLTSMAHHPPAVAART